MQLQSNDTGDIRILSVEENRIDAASAVQFKDQVRELTRDGPARVLLDLENVGFIDSSGLGAVVASYKLLAPDQTLELSNLGTEVAKVFHLTRMDKVFRIHDTNAAAGQATY